MLRHRGNRCNRENIPAEMVVIYTVSISFSSRQWLAKLCSRAKVVFGPAQLRPLFKHTLHKQHLGIVNTKSGGKPGQVSPNLQGQGCVPPHPPLLLLPKECSCSALAFLRALTRMPPKFQESWTAILRAMDNAASRSMLH